MGKPEKIGSIQDNKLHFLFTESGFAVEIRGELPENAERLVYWYGKFREDKYQALYNIGFNEKPDCLDAAGAFLYLLSDSYQKYILRQPDLELARDKLRLNFEEEIQDKLLRSVPFAPGSEWVDAEWIARQLDTMHEICLRISRQSCFRIRIQATHGYII